MPQGREDAAKQNSLGNLAQLRRQKSEYGKVPFLSYQTEKLKIMTVLSIDRMWEKQPGTLTHADGYTNW